MSVANQTRSSWPHRIAIAMVSATFPLIWVGGLVTTHHAGMAVPDWPNTYGYNLFLYPLSTWLAGPFDLFIEHGHRLLGATVGLIAIALVITLFRTESSRSLRLLSVVALIGVCLQGALGGIRVRLDERTFAMIHACVGPAFFAVAVALAAMTSTKWQSPVSPIREVRGGQIQRLAIFTALLAYLQLILGAQLRHTPLEMSIGFFRTMLYFHLLVATALLVHVVLLARATWHARANAAILLRPAFGLVALMALQLSLGAGTWVVKYGWPKWLGEHAWTASYTVQREDLVSSMIVTGHVAIGSLILAVSVLLTMRAFRYLQADRPQFSSLRTLSIGVAA